MYAPMSGVEGGSTFRVSKKGTSACITAYNQRLCHCYTIEVWIDKHKDSQAGSSLVIGTLMCPGRFKSELWELMMMTANM